MSFLWPQALWLLAALALLGLAYWLALRARRRVALRYAGLELVRAVAVAGGWRRHLPPLLMLLALAALVLAMARPVAVVMLPVQDQAVILAMDVSGSMRATDIAPDRLRAAQAAAKSFVEALPRGVRVGVVAFAATSALVQSPTHDRAEVAAAIDRFQLQRGTALGSGIVVSLATLFPEAGIQVGEFQSARDAPLAKVPDTARSQAPVPPGSHTSAVIVLLSDGQRTTGPDTLEAARLAAAHGVRIHTVGLGTPEGQVIGFEGWSMRVRLDEEALREIARITHGEYFHAGSAEALHQVYRSLTSRLVMERAETEVSALFVALGAALAAAAALLSLWWFNRVL